MNDDFDPGIWPPYEAFYIESMLFSTRSAISAVEAANFCLDRCDEWEDDPEMKSRDEDMILDEIQNLINCGAALSRYFWPSGKSRINRRRARHLRDALAMTDESPLKNRDLRNHLEHFDERLDTLVKDGVVGQIFPKFVGNAPRASEVPHFIFRAYYVDPPIFEVLGNRYEIAPLLSEIQRVHFLLLDFSENGSVFPREEAG